MKTHHFPKRFPHGFSTPATRSVQGIAKGPLIDLLCAFQKVYIIIKKKYIKEQHFWNSMKKHARPGWILWFGGFSPWGSNEGAP